MIEPLDSRKLLSLRILRLTLAPLSMSQAQEQLILGSFSLLFLPPTKLPYAMSKITRLHPAQRYSEVSVHNDTVYLTGQVAEDATQDIAGQTVQVLAAVDRLLREAGSDKTQILMAQIFLADMADFAGMNAAWDSWVARDSLPCRATVQARLAKPQWRIEVVITAATVRK